MENYNLEYISNKVAKFFDSATTEFREDRFHIGKCMSFIIGDNSDTFYWSKGITTLMICELAKCHISGTKILKKLDAFVASLNEDGFDIKSIILRDESHVFWNTEKYSLKVDLQKLKILTNGESWYNSMGYYQGNFDEEKEQWDIIRNMTFREIVDKYLNIRKKLYQYRLFYDFGKYIGIKPNLTNIDQVIQKALEVIKKVYTDDIDSIPIKKLVLFISNKHLICRISDEDLFADGFILFFSEEFIEATTDMENKIE